MPPARRQSGGQSQASKRISCAGFVDDGDGIISHEEAAQLVELWQDLLAQEARQEDELDKLKRAMLARRDANAALRQLGTADRRLRRHTHRIINRSLEYGGAVTIQAQWKQLKDLRAAQAEAEAAGDVGRVTTEPDQGARQNYLFPLQSRLRLRRALSKMMDERAEVAAEAMSLFEGSVRPMAARKAQLKSKLRHQSEQMHGEAPSKMPRMHPALQSIREAQEGAHTLHVPECLHALHALRASPTSHTRHAPHAQESWHRCRDY